MSQDKPTLCWKCARACGGCSWSDGSFTPVTGWKAKPTIITMAGRIIKSYKVIKCPLFKDDTEQYRKAEIATVWKSPEQITKHKPRARIKRGSLRDRISKLKDLRERIERLNGDEQIVAKLILLYHYTTDEVAVTIFKSRDTVRVRLKNALLEMEAMS